MLSLGYNNINNLCTCSSHHSLSCQLRSNQKAHLPESAAWATRARAMAACDLSVTKRRRNSNNCSSSDNKMVFPAFCCFSTRYYWYISPAGIMKISWFQRNETLLYMVIYMCKKKNGRPCSPAPKIPPPKNASYFRNNAFDAGKVGEKAPVALHRAVVTNQFKTRGCLKKPQSSCRQCVQGVTAVQVLHEGTQRA